MLIKLIIKKEDQLLSREFSIPLRRYFHYASRNCSSSLVSIFILDRLLRAPLTRFEGIGSWECEGHVEEDRVIPQRQSSAAGHAKRSDETIWMRPDRGILKSLRLVLSSCLIPFLDGRRGASYNDVSPVPRRRFFFFLPFFFVVDLRETK